MTFFGRIKELLAELNVNFFDLKEFPVLLGSHLLKQGCRGDKKVQAAKHRHIGSHSRAKKN